MRVSCAGNVGAFERPLMLDQFSRTRLVFGYDAVESLSHKRVAVFGIGGVGGHAAEALVRTGVGAIDIIDDDKVCLTNLNRQVIATWKTIGQYKIDVMEQRLLDINPSCTVRKHACFYLPENADQFDFTEYDYIIDAVDTVTAKLNLIMQARETGTPIISAMGAGNKTDPTMVRIADIYETSICRLARIMRKELRKRGVDHLKVAYSPEPTVEPQDDMASSCRTHCVCPPGTQRTCLDRRAIPGSNVFVPSAMGIAIAAEVTKDLMAQG